MFDEGGLGGSYWPTKLGTPILWVIKSQAHAGTETGNQEHGDLYTGAGHRLKNTHTQKKR